MNLLEFKAKLRDWHANVNSPDDKLAIPSLIEDLSSTCPWAGQGVHHWLPKATYVLAHWPFRMPFKGICQILEDTMLAHGRTPKNGEVADAVNFVMKSAHKFKSKRKRTPKLPLVNPKLERQAALAFTGGEREVVRRSPIQKPGTLSTYEVLSRRFPDGAKLSFTEDDPRIGVVYRLSPKWIQFFAIRKVPERMVPHVWQRRTKHGSQRAKGDFDWQYQITEFDSGTRDEQASKILWLSEREGAPELVQCNAWI
jgi:hypothetical protein